MLVLQDPLVKVDAIHESTRKYSMKGLVVLIFLSHTIFLLKAHLMLCDRHLTCHDVDVFISH